ncbi:cytochrome P450 11B, mitochondrial-like [Hemicordylus capensis]|uniref:cytochrome P450 11B, mitochondrial-like n=1 Tax=Hemicordylus capensis TaxID=884348 RepID=UPI002303B09B|nr:cytochrome P450 11B, mitochondrial-like [Hemicordylus capensis]
MSTPREPFWGWGFRACWEAAWPWPAGAPQQQGYKSRPSPAGRWAALGRDEQRPQRVLTWGSSPVAAAAAAEMGAHSRLRPCSAHRSLSRSFWLGRPCLSVAPAVATEPAPSKALPFEAIPHNGHNAWLNLYQFWRSNSFQNFHLVMQRNFQSLGPIYRERVGTYDCVNVLLPQDAAQLFQSEGVFPRRMGIESWVAHRTLRNHKCGIFLLNGEEWRSDRLVLNKEVISPLGTRKFLPFLNTVAEDFVDFMHRKVRKNTRRSLTVDLYHDLFRYTLEASSYAVYGERLGLLEESPNAESQQFISAVETMLRTTLPLLFISPGIMRWVNNKLWQDHMDAWDTIFKHADKCIQNIYQEFCLGQPRKYSGIMAELLLQAELPLDSIKANITEFTAGGVDTTAMPLLFTLFELARNPQVQTAIREEIQAAQAQGPSELSKVLNCLPLLKGAIKETLRLYPVGITVQRYPTRDVLLQNYCVPAGTLCQVGLYAMGRSPEVFREPERYDPKRWLRREDNSFKALAFGFGARQCIGRRLAESEMMLFLMHVLRNFKIDTVSKADIKTVFGFILMPEKPPLLTFRPID